MFFRFFKEPTYGTIFLLLLMLLEAWPSKMQVLKHFLSIGLSLILCHSKAHPPKKIEKDLFFQVLMEARIAVDSPPTVSAMSIFSSECRKLPLGE